LLDDNVFQSRYLTDARALQGKDLAYTAPQVEEQKGACRGSHGDDQGVLVQDVQGHGAGTAPPTVQHG
jgi:hypothetical protein